MFFLALLLITFGFPSIVSTVTDSHASSNNITETIYTPKGSQMWQMNASNPGDDPRFDPKTKMTMSEDGSWKVQDEEHVRLNVFTSKGYNESKIDTLEKAKLEAKGYMQSPLDWKNVEMTGIVKLNSINKDKENDDDDDEWRGGGEGVGETQKKKSTGDNAAIAPEDENEFEENDDNFSWYARGGLHNNRNNGCEGTAYKGFLYYSGNSGFGKELRHTDGFVDTIEKKVTDPIVGKWVGFKFVLYDFKTEDNSTAVKMENWIDNTGEGNNWTKVHEAIDSGQWINAEYESKCGERTSDKILWGGPIATFRWDNAHDVNIKNFSVHEIVPPKINASVLSD